ncbi:hypothetical protein J5226_16790 [Lysobacter sp. K5869]|uniref:hypothetical protein n=1 Tax=Lysobacter sp. K5869 TaxID=2820808 RepID=UPI001C06402A|nr:hypothetical protein [Lysobacter sp. K5869]QWP75274.1 hypothetical protein J5226_16790 [Lysobacter sp. K5869]
MTHNDPLFHFSAPWFELGVVTPAQLQGFRKEWSEGDDHSPEHYRWRAFTAFLDERRPLAPDTVAALYSLGAADVDRAMGEAMMHRLVELPECPEHVVSAAESSGVPHLTKAAARHRATIKSS